MWGSCSEVPYRDKTHVWKLSISPKTGGYTEKDLLHWQKQAEAWAEAEWLALEKSKKQFSRSAQASSWTLEMLLTKYLKGLDDESIKYRSCASDRSRVRVLLGIAEKGANAHNKAFAPVLGKTMDELAPTDFYTERPKSHPRAILLHYKGRNGQPRRSQESSATRDLNSAISFSIASCGVAHPNVFLGRPFISEAT